MVFGGWWRVALRDGGANIRQNVIEPLRADVLMALTYRTDDACNSTSSCNLDARFAGLGPIAALQLERQLTTMEFAEKLEQRESWEVMWRHFEAGPFRCRRHRAPNAPAHTYSCARMRENGNAFTAPVVGNPALHVLHEQYAQSRLLRMLAAEEARRSARYDAIVWTRLEFHWLHPHPPLHLPLPTAAAAAPTRPASSSSSAAAAAAAAAAIRGALAGAAAGGGSTNSSLDLAACPVWSPRGEDYGGLNDRHAALSRDAAAVYLGRWDLLDSGALNRVPQLCCPWFNGTLDNQTRLGAISSERLLAVLLLHFRLTSCRFPPFAYLLCCDVGGRASCNKRGCVRHEVPPYGALASKYSGEMLAAVAHADVAHSPGAGFALSPSILSAGGFWHECMPRGQALTLTTTTEGRAALHAQGRPRSLSIGNAVPWALIDFHLLRGQHQQPHHVVATTASNLNRSQILPHTRTAHLHQRSTDAANTANTALNHTQHT